MYVHQQIQWPCLEIISAIDGNVSTAVSKCLLSASASLFNHLFKAPSLFDGEPPPPHSKIPVISSAIVKIVIKREVSIESIVMPCSRNKVRILSAKDLFFSTTFLMVCLILETF